RTRSRTTKTSTRTAAFPTGTLPSTTKRSTTLSVPTTTRRSTTTRLPTTTRFPTTRLPTTTRFPTTRLPTTTRFPTTTGTFTYTLTDFVPRPTLTLPTATFTAGSKPTPTFRVVPYTQDSILEGQQLIVDPALKDASPDGWFGDLQIDGELITFGNNARADRRTKLGVSRNNGKFDQVYDTTADPETEQNIAAATANAFYMVNMYHDLLYRYGFTEASANFQFDNFGKGGLGGDGVIANVQADFGTNNAFFGTPPDGSSGEMYMLIFDITDPRTDSDLDNGIVIHELTHGLSNRLTGGTGNANCLQTLESAGMGEGWSDTLGWWASTKPGADRTVERAMGLYVLDTPNGVRQYKYSTNMTSNPLKNSDFPLQLGVHGVGTVWSTMLYEVFWNM
ncbi:hypothetical protein HDU67_005047, partial [Dinochytrium kinnereticum]